MTIEDLVAKLTQMREASTRGIDMTATMHLFGIIFDTDISASGATAPEIAGKAPITSKKSVSAEIADGRNLARYVTVNPEVIDRWR